MTAFSCRPIAPRAWRGRYLSVVGNPATAFHIRVRGGEWWPCVDWQRAGELGTCWAIGGAEIRTLTKAVNDGKRALGSSEGGSFLINEWGQVLVPSSNYSAGVVLVAEVAGTPFFDDPWRPGVPVSLSDDRGLQPGDAWERPYVGCQYNLSKRHAIYCKRRDEEEGSIEWGPGGHALVHTLRSIRDRGPVRFVVNPHGIVLTKQPTGPWNEESWQPVYVGRISTNGWFPKEA